MSSYFSDEEWRLIRRGEIDRVVAAFDRSHFHSCVRQLRFAKTDRESDILIELSMCTDPLRRRILEVHLDSERLRQMREQSEDREFFRSRGRGNHE